nr:two-component response regulator ARR12 [Lilium lancifolium]
MEEGRADQFPIGMRVLAVDDDLSCLRTLERMLTCCQYRVTTTGQATEALRLLRENRDGFDLVISDVHMPDMDGFKLLELVGLEMDLPVIMLSGNGQTEAVMKGINHGACDYLVKPVRIQELKNIWQHVVRRKISEARDENSSDDGEDSGKGQVSNLGGQLPATSGATDRNGRLNRKRKDQIEQYEDEYEGNTNEDNGSTQKKQRVVWSIELHRKFVDAVNQLGVDRAVPKKILEIMNVEKITRENVASHLQKYRLYLKRLNFMAIRQAHMAAALRGRHSSYHSMNQLEEFGNVHPSGGSMQLPAFASFQSNGVLGRMNTSTGFRQQGVLPSGIVQHGRVHNNTSNCINADLLGSADGKFLQEMHMPLDMDRSQHNTVTEVNNRFAGVYSGSGLAIGSSSNSIANVANNPLEFPLNQQHMSSDPYKIGLGDSSNLSGLGECNNTWQGAVPSYNFPANSSPMAVSSSNITMPSLSILGDVNPIVAYLDTGLSEASSDNVAVAPLCDSGVESYVQHQANSLGCNTMLMPTCVDENSEFLSNSGSKWGELNQNLAHNPNALFGSSASLSHLQIADTNAENSMPRNMEMDQFLAQDRRTDNQMNYIEECTSENTNTHGGFSSNNCGFPDFGKDDLAFFGDMIGDIFSPNSCM